MTKTQRRRAVAAVVIAGAIALLLYWRSRPKSGHQVAATAVGAEGLIPATTRLPTGLRGQIGATRAYRVSMNNSTVIDTGATIGTEGSMEQTLELQFKAIWLLKELPSDAGDILVQAQLVAETLNISNSESPVPQGDLASLKQTLGHSLVIRYGANGRVLGIRVPPLLDTDPGAFMPLKSLIGSLQIVYAETAGDAWEVVEEDQTAAVIASYAWNKIGLLNKSKLKYQEQPPGDVPTIGNGLDVTANLNASFGLTESGWIAKANSAEQTTLKMAGILGANPGEGDISMYSNTDVQAALLAVSPFAIEPLPAAWTTWPERPLADSSMRSRQRPELDPEFQLALTVDILDLVDSLAKLGDGIKDTDNRISLEQLLAMALQARPNEIDVLVNKILDGTYVEDKAADVLNALSTAATPEAQAGLAKVMDGADVAERERQGAVWSFHGIDKPTVATLDALRKGMDEYPGQLGSTSLLAYGRVAGNMDRDPSEGDPEAAAAAVRELIARFRRENDQAQQAVLLDAIGNSGHPLALSVMVDIIGASGHRLRLMAIRGLRFMPVGQADDLVVRLMASLDSEEDRGAAVYASSFRNFQTYAPVWMARIKVEESVSVAMAMFQIVGARLNYPQVADFVDWLRENGIHAELRHAAADLLAPAQPPEE